MGLFSFLNKNKQDSTASDSGYVSRDDDPAAALARSKRASNAGGAKGRRPARETPDPVLPEKKRARRRLVGAIALALGVAVGLPMILDSEPKPLNNDIAIEIPSKEKPAVASASASATAAAPAANANGLDPSEEVVEAPPAGKPSPAVTAPAVAEVKAPAESAKPPKAEPFDMPKADVKAEARAKADAKVRADAEAALKAEQRADARLAAAKAEPKHEKPPVKVEAHTDDAARALAILEGKPVAKAAEKTAPEAGGRFIVQIAALATQEKVDELQNKLRDAGIKSYTQKVPTPSGDRIRVRMGPFSSRDEAEKARARLVKIGLNGSLVPA